MKRILTILLVVMMVFSITGCDPEGRAKLAGYMGKMGQNVMGTDTSSANELSEMSKVDSSEVQPAPDANAEGKVEISFGAPAVGEGGSESAPAINVKIDASELQTVDDGDKKEIPLLPPMKEKDAFIKKMGSSLTNNASKETLVKNMSAKVDDEKVEAATKNSAKIMSAALNELTTSEVAESIPENVKSSITEINESLNKMTEKNSTVTQADIVVLQLVQDFVSTVSSNTDNIKTGDIPQQVISDANNLVVVATSLSQATSFNYNTIDFASIISRIPTASSTETSSVKSLRTRAGETAKDEPKENITIDKFELEEVYQSTVKTAYDQLVLVGGNGKDFDSIKKGLGYHKSAYENFASVSWLKLALDVEYNDKAKTSKLVNAKGVSPENLAKGVEYRKSEEFKKQANTSSVMQYAMAAIISEADNVFQSVKKQLNEDPQLKAGITADNIMELIDDFVAVNPWVKKPSAQPVKIVIPSKYTGLADKLGNWTEEEWKQFGEGILAEVAKRPSIRSALTTLTYMVPFINITDIIGSLNMDVDLGYYIHFAIQNLDEINADLETQEKGM